MIIIFSLYIAFYLVIGLYVLYIAIADLPGSDGESVARRIAAERRVAVVSHDVDLTIEQQVRDLPGRVEDSLGGIDVVVHSAGLVGTSSLDGWAVPFEEQSAYTWRHALEVNLTSAFVLCQSAMPQLVRSGRGSIVLVSSVYGLIGADPYLYEGTSMASPAAYFASKGGLLQLTRWLATSLGSSVRANAICPGGIERGQPAQFVQRYVAKTPLSRLGTEDDLRGAIAFLASDLSAYVTGQSIVVDGGLTIR